MKRLDTFMKRLIRKIRTLIFKNKYYYGIDWSRGKDYSIKTTLRTDKKGKCHLDNVEIVGQEVIKHG